MSDMPKKYSLQELFEMYPGDYSGDEELDWGEPVGDEVWWRDEDGRNGMRVYTVKMIWDDGYWHTGTDSDLGITLSSDSFDALVERVRMAAPEMLELNCGYSGDVELVFETVRREVVTKDAGLRIKA